MEQCPHCRGTGSRQRHGPLQQTASLAEAFQVKLDMAEGRLRKLTDCKLCCGDGQISEARSAAYKMCGYQGALQLPPVAVALRHGLHLVHPR